jgi:hypothetical protein
VNEFVAAPFEERVVRLRVGVEPVDALQPDGLLAPLPALRVHLERVPRPHPLPSDPDDAVGLPPLRRSRTGRFAIVFGSPRTDPPPRLELRICCPAKVPGVASVSPSVVSTGQAVSTASRTRASARGSGSNRATDRPAARNRAVQLWPITPPPRDATRVISDADTVGSLEGEPPPGFRGGGDRVSEGLDHPAVGVAEQPGGDVVHVTSHAPVGEAAPTHDR